MRLLESENFTLLLIIDTPSLWCDLKKHIFVNIFSEEVFGN